MNPIRSTFEWLWPAASVTVNVIAQMLLRQASCEYSCETSAGGAVLQLPLMDVPSPKSSVQLVMSPGRGYVFDHVEVE